MTTKERMYRNIEWTELYKLVEENSKGLINTTDEKRKQLVITKLTNSFCKAGCFNRIDICEARDLTKRYGLGGHYAKAVIRNIKGDYDEEKAKEKRLAEIDAAIAKLLEERATLV